MMSVSPTGLRRAVSRRVPWRGAVPGTDDVPIGPLVSPLRYDVLVRARFFDFLGERTDLAASDPTELVRQAARTPYRTWFERVAMARFRPRLVEDPARLDAAFGVRVLGAARLLGSFRSSGYDRRHPIVLRVGTARTRHAEGKPVIRDLYVGDGCHRLALLMSAGWRVLPAGLHRIDGAPLQVVPDNTARLLAVLGVTQEDYASFLSLGYSGQRHTSVASLLAEVAQSRPDQLEELRAVVAADTRSHPSLAWTTAPPPRTGAP
jgi:hypothetical protein